MGWEKAFFQQVRVKSFKLSSQSLDWVKFIYFLGQIAAKMATVTNTQWNQSVANLLRKN